MQLRARDLMTSPPIAVSADATLLEAARTMVGRNVGSVLVLDTKGRLEGILTENEFVGHAVDLPFSDYALTRVFGHFPSLDGLRAIYNEAAGSPVRKFMVRDVATVDPDTTVEAIVEVMAERKVRHVPVVDGGKVVGMVARHDLLRLLLDRLVTAAGAT